MFDWLTELCPNAYLMIVILTFLPFLELRASIPYGILIADKPWLPVVALAIAANIALGPIIYWFLENLLHLLLKVRAIEKTWNRIVVRTQKKVHPLVEKYGVWGLSVFIGIPLPGSGVYSGAFGGYLIGFTKKEFYIATVLGVLIAAALVTAVVMTGATTFDLFIKKS